MRGLIFGGLIGGAGGLLVGLLIGLAISQGFGFVQSGGTNIPYDQKHLNIASKITVHDKTANVALTLKHIQTGPSEFYPYAPYSAFNPRRTYTQSLWVWCQDNDIDVTMVIWGPGDDGKSFLIGFGRHMWNAVEIKGFGHVSGWGEGGPEGYADWVITA